MLNPWGITFYPLPLPSYSSNLLILGTLELARAMGNMGATDLRLVNPANPLHPEAIDRATRAESILRQARTFENLETAIADLERVMGRQQGKSQTRQGHCLTRTDGGGPTGSGKVGLVLEEKAVGDQPGIGPLQSFDAHSHLWGSVLPQPLACRDGQPV